MSRFEELTSFFVISSDSDLNKDELWKLILDICGSGMKRGFL
jgi:hypothetical protein